MSVKEALSLSLDPLQQQRSGQGCQLRLYKSTYSAVPLKHGQFSPKFSQKALHIYGVYFVGPNFDLYYILCFIGSRYSGTPL